MSNRCMALVQRRVMGSATRKSVMMYLADRASDDGTGIWTSKAHIAADTELSKRSVQTAMKEFEAEGLLKRTGERPCNRGFTYEYEIVMDAIEKLPSTREGVQEIHPRGAGDSPLGVQEIHPNPPKNPPRTKETRESALSLFSETEEPEKSGSRVDQENDRFDEFWKVYPKKEGKPSARKAWAKAVKRADPDEIIAGAKAYADWLSSAVPGEFRPHTKHPQGWLNDDRWEAFTGQVEAYREEDLSPNQRNALREGRIPPSLQNTDGSPNAKARYWLTAYGYGEAAE